ncbi:MAG TPA: phosphate ABC transporter permease subunit PstC, partial [Methanomassiliicoccales archaeon]|nr:phosphate ABC transporter permease subunit PstC [Methanomassiliicoccales archaeon]
MAQKVTARRRRIFRALVESGIAGLMLVCAFVSVAVLILVFTYLIGNALPFFGTENLGQFLGGTVWAPFATNPQYGVLPLLMGTILVSFVAAIIAVPIGIGCTIYISELASPSVRRFLKPAIEVLASVPSVVYGLFAALVLSDWLASIFNPVTRLNALNGAVILAVMMIPILVSIAEEAMNSVPRHLKEASLALGANRWETVRRTIIPAALPGIVAAIVLSIGRAVGETMAVIMATGNSTQFTTNILASVRTMTATLAINVPEAANGTTQYYALFAVGLLLFIITFAINIIADYVMARYREAY